MRPLTANTRLCRLGAMLGALGLFIFSPAHAAGETGGSFWRIEQGRVVDEAGHNVRMRGVNLGDWLHWEGYLFGGSVFASDTRLFDGLVRGMGEDRAMQFRKQYMTGFITERDIAQIAALGFNTIRLPVNWRTLTQDPTCPRCDGAGFEAIDRVLGWAARYNVHVIIDMHSAPLGQAKLPTADPAVVPDSDPRVYRNLYTVRELFSSSGETLWNSPVAQQKLVDLWTTIARRYADNPAVGGYDLINEPVAPSDLALNALYGRLIAAVRSVDHRHIIWLEGNMLASRFSGFQGPLGENVGLSVHLYTVFGDQRAQHIADAGRAAVRTGAPLWLGEFGEDTPHNLASTLTMADAAPHIAGWTFWTWKRAADPHPGLCVYTPPPAWRGVVGWLTGADPSLPQPSEAAAEQGGQALLRTIADLKCEPDPAALQVLRTH